MTNGLQKMWPNGRLVRIKQWSLNNLREKSLLCVSLGLLALVSLTLPTEASEGKNQSHVPPKTLEMVKVLEWVFFDNPPQTNSGWSNRDIVRASVKVAMVTGGCKKVDNDKYIVSIQAVDTIAERYFGKGIVTHEIPSEKDSSITYTGSNYTSSWNMDDMTNSYFVSSRLMNPNTCTVLLNGINDDDQKSHPSALFTLSRKNARSPWHIAAYKSLWK